MRSILKIENLVKCYGKTKALNGLNLDFETGKIYGLLGPNGSGKTTFLKICAALIMNYKGKVLINGSKPGLDTKSIVAYLPDGEYFFGWMKVKDALNFFNDFFDDFDRERAEQLLDYMELEHEQKISKLSKGMKARLKLAIVLGRKAKLYLLDEPFDGIDPVTREKIIDVVLSTFNVDSAIIMATHHISYVEKLLDVIQFLAKGEIIYQAAADDTRQINQMSVNEYYLEVFKDVKAD